MSTLAMLGHQGGWDEALFVAIPLGLIFLALFSAKKRAEQQGATPRSGDAVDPDDVSTQSGQLPD